MMKHKLLVVGLLALSLLGCKEIAKLTQFEMEYNETVVIPSSTGISLPINILTPDIETNSESTFAVNDTRKDLIEEIKLTSMVLNLTSPSNGNFGFLESIAIYISADGLSETKIAWKDIVPASTDKTLMLDVADTDLKEYIKKDNFSLRVNTVTDELLTSDHTIDIASIFFVDAEILGI